MSDHEDTKADQQNRRKGPLRQALINSAVTLAIVGFGGLLRAVRFWEFHEWFARWVFPAVAVWIVVMCFGHAYLGAAIGKRKADVIFLALLLASLVALVLGLIHHLDNR